MEGPEVLVSALGQDTVDSLLEDARETEAWKYRKKVAVGRVIDHASSSSLASGRCQCLFTSPNDVAVRAWGNGLPEQSYSHGCWCTVARHTARGGLTYPYEMLLQGKAWPPEVVPDERERYLTDEEFRWVFGLGKHEFLLLPAWRQRLLKQDARLI
mmetsp:Transcript_2998/g.8469  ORF Transcript_2998/g.8469 Transcript_2998/m.8469 type:complete len:156 (-) Transcript_2998:1604-2071(-)